MLIGGAAGPKMFSAIAEWADGWMPIGAGGLATALPTLRAAVEAAGRDPATIWIAPMAVIPTAQKLDYYETLGIDEVGLRLPTAGRDDILRALDEYAAVVTNG